jgi:hypothetical protein
LLFVICEKLSLLPGALPFNEAASKLLFTIIC